PQARGRGRLAWEVTRTSWKQNATPFASNKPPHTSRESSKRLRLPSERARHDPLPTRSAARSRAACSAVFWGAPGQGDAKTSTRSQGAGIKGHAVSGQEASRRLCLFELERKGEHSRWNTLRALRVLKWWGDAKRAAR